MNQDLYAEIAKLRTEILRSQINVEIIRQKNLKSKTTSRSFLPFEEQVLIDEYTRIEELSDKLCDLYKQIRENRKEREFAPPRIRKIKTLSVELQVL